LPADVRLLAAKLVILVDCNGVLNIWEFGWVPFCGALALELTSIFLSEVF
jgi:hypothetical protein